MRLKGLLYEGYRDNHHKQILLEIRKDRYFLLYKSGISYTEIDITQKVDELCEGLLRMNIVEWNQNHYDSGMDSFPHYNWRLSVSFDDVMVQCNGSSNFPTNWDEFVLLFRGIGIRL